MEKSGPFETLTDRYEQWFVKNARLYELELAAVRELLPGGRGLEVGVGTGRFAQPLGIGLGVEPSAQMAQRARERGISVVSGVAEQLPFEAGTFDFVLFVTTICFVESVPKSLQEAHRVLPRGGSLLVAFVDRESDLGRRYEAQKASSEFYAGATFFSTAQIIASMEEAGFGNFIFRQTLLPGMPPDAVLPGYGAGAFVVVRGQKS